MEFVDHVLPGFDPRMQVRLMDEKTPDEVDLQNCKTADEAWMLKWECGCYHKDAHQRAGELPT